MENKNNSFKKITDDRKFILHCYQEMLKRINEYEVLQLIENDAEFLLDLESSSLTSEKIIQSLSIYFQLMTMVEENAATQYRRKMENEKDISSIRGSWAETFQIWKDLGIAEDEMIQTISSVDIMPVLTAHPTESKRVTVIEIHRDLYLLLVQRENTSLSKMEQMANTEKIISLIERWWRTGEIHLEKPNITDERTNILHYLSKVFPSVVEKSDIQLKSSWKGIGFNTLKVSNPDFFPNIHFGSWVGGDRDGHPFVTPAITQETLILHRQEALKIIHQKLINLAAKLTISGISNPVPLALQEAITLIQTNSTQDFKATVSSGVYDFYITKWGLKNIFLPQVNISNNTATSFNLLTEAGFEDNFQTNLGWTVVNSAGVQGGWVRTVPRGTLSGDGFWANPNQDSDDQGNIAWVTGNGIPGANCNDVDNGSTELRSPNFDLTTYKQPTLNFDVWFYAGNGTIPPDDTLIIKISNGLTEALVEKIFKPTLSWKKVRNVDIKKLIQPTSNMQLKIIASDQSGVNGHIVEAGFDQFFISELATSSVSTPELLTAQLSVSPNPTQDVFTIKKSSPSPHAPFAIFDVLGRMILSGVLKDEETLVQAIDWQPGVFYLKAENHKTSKIIRQ